MRPFRAFALVVSVGALLLNAATVSSADETDNFTCRARLSRDSLPVLDSWVNARIQEALARANRRGAVMCGEACLARELQKAVGGSRLHPLTFVPHSRLERWVTAQGGLDRCHLGFRDTIYGARPYNQPWLFPFLGRIILVADSILLADRVVGLDKLNHFIREGLAHWRAVTERGALISTALERELDPASQGWHWTEYGLKGLSLTGVPSYADVAAGYSGFVFWSELLTFRGERPLVAFDTAGGRFVQARSFTFADYVTDAWDEGINRSEFDPALAKEVDAALRHRGLAIPVPDCRVLSELPDASLYVNPRCRAAEPGTAR